MLSNVTGHVSITFSCFHKIVYKSAADSVHLTLGVFVVTIATQSVNMWEFNRTRTVWFCAHSDGEKLEHFRKVLKSLFSVGVGASCRHLLGWSQLVWISSVSRDNEGDSELISNLLHYSQAQARLTLSSPLSSCWM